MCRLRICERRPTRPPSTSRRCITPRSIANTPSASSTSRTSSSSYATFIQSPKDYVIGQALRRLFEKDHEFAEWLKGHGVTAPASHDALTDELGDDTRARLATSPRVTSRTREEQGL